jgi:hypothetical protein
MSNGDKLARVDPIPSDDREKGDEEEREELQPDSLKRENAMAVGPDTSADGKKKGKKGKEAEDELSDEDRELKEKLELLVVRAQDTGTRESAGLRWWVGGCVSPWVYGCAFVS